MKKILYALGIIILFSVLLMCEKDPDNGPNKKINWIKTELSGCNGEIFDNKKSLIVEEDTVIFRIINDTLDVFVGVNYICCAPFITTTSISNDSLIMNITDTCNIADHSCYCRCICYYIFDFLFVDFENKKYPFKIILNDPGKDSPIIFEEGILDLRTGD